MKEKTTFVSKKLDDLKHTRDHLRRELDILTTAMEDCSQEKFPVELRRTQAIIKTLGVIEGLEKELWAELPHPKDDERGPEYETTSPPLPKSDVGAEKDYRKNYCYLSTEEVQVACLMYAKLVKGLPSHVRREDVEFVCERGSLVRVDI